MKTELQEFTNQAVKTNEALSVFPSQEPIRPKEYGVPSVISSQESADPRERGATSVIPIGVQVGPREHGTLSIIPSQELAHLKERGATNVIPSQVPAGQRVREGSPIVGPGGEEALLTGRGKQDFPKKSISTVKSIADLPPDTLKCLLKTKIILTEIK